VKKLFGEILTDLGLIRQDQLQQALEEQKRGGKIKRLGQILTEMGIITEADIVIALSTQFNLPYLPLKHVSLNREVCKLVPLAFAQRFHFIPVDKINDALIIAIADPTDEHAIPEIGKTTKCKIQTFISTFTEIDDAIREYYGKEKPH
jgi:type IV pilus assembly protein PilB